MVRFLRDCLNPTHQKPHEVVVWHQPTLLATIQDGLGTLGTRSSYGLLGVINADPPVEPGITHLIGLVLSDYGNVIQEHVERPSWHSWQIAQITKKTLPQD